MEYSLLILFNYEWVIQSSYAERFAIKGWKSQYGTMITHGTEMTDYGIFFVNII